MLVDIPPEVGTQIEEYPFVFPVLTGDIVQDYLAGSTVFKGKVANLGSLTATFVHVEIETFDASGNRMDILTGYVDGVDLAPGMSGSFTAITSFDYTNFTSSMKWTDEKHELCIAINRS